MEKSEITRKESKLRELRDLENEINKEVNLINSDIRKCFRVVNTLLVKKEKLIKRISHNMKLRNKIITELHFKK